MSLGDDLKDKVAEIFKEKWTTRDGQVVPKSSDIQLANDAVKLDAVVLYADMSGSTKLVDNYKAHFAAEIYKSYLHCAAKIIRSEGGEITSYDGDRIMAVFLGDYKNTSAVRSALKINYARFPPLVHGYNILRFIIIPIVVYCLLAVTRPGLYIFTCHGFIALCVHILDKYVASNEHEHGGRNITINCGSSDDISIYNQKILAGYH